MFITLCSYGLSYKEYFKPVFELSKKNWGSLARPKGPGVKNGLPDWYKSNLVGLSKELRVHPQPQTIQTLFQTFASQKSSADNNEIKIIM